MCPKHVRFGKPHCTFLTEVPILQGLIASGMGKGPALALLLAGPSLSLPNMLVIRGVMGTPKTVVYVGVVVVLSAIAGLVFGALWQSKKHKTIMPIYALPIWDISRGKPQ